MDYDKIIPHIGGFGRYQRRIYFLLCLPVILFGFHTMVGVFLAARTDFRCLLPNESTENATYKLPLNITNRAYPWDNKTKSWSQCERYDVDLTDHPYDLGENLSFTIPTVKCSSFVYDKTIYKRTVVTEFNLVCDNAWLGATADSLFMVGTMLGAMISGALSDRYGRRPIFCLCLVLNLVSGLLVAASHEIISYMILRMVVGLSAYGVFMTAYVAAIEIASPKKRLIAGIGFELSFTSGYLLTSGFAYFITNWRILQIAITVPSLAFVVYWWFIPESVRWLLSKGRSEEAKNLLKKASLENRVELSEEMLDSMLKISQITPDLKESSILDLLRYPNLRRKSILLFYIGFVINFTYYGISWNTSNLGGNDYINFVISGLVEIPSYLIILLTLNKWGRKIIFCTSFVFAGSSLLLATLVPSDTPWLMILLIMIGKSAITGSVSTGHIFTVEQFPTVIRNIGVGAYDTCAQIGGIMAPAVIHSSSYWRPLAPVIFGCSSLLAGVAVLFLPETLNKKLPDTILEGEDMEDVNDDFTGGVKMREVEEFILESCNHRSS